MKNMMNDVELTQQDIKLIENVELYAGAVFKVLMGILAIAVFCMIANYIGDALIAAQHMDADGFFTGIDILTNEDAFNSMIHCMNDPIFKEVTKLFNMFI